MNLRPQESTTPAPRRSHFRRYGLRTLLGVMAVVAVVCAYAASVRRQYVVEQEVVRELRRRHHTVGVENRPPFPLRSLPASWKWFDRPVVVYIEGRTGDEVVSMLGQLRQLERLWIMDLSGEEVDWSPLSRMPRLRRLDFTGVNFDDEDFVHLANLENLESLDLSQTRIRGAGLIHIRNLPRLEQLNIMNCRLSNETIDLLLQMPNLKTMNLSNTPIPDAEVRRLYAHPNIEAIAY